MGVDPGLVAINARQNGAFGFVLAQVFAFIRNSFFNTNCVRYAFLLTHFLSFDKDSVWQGEIIPWL